MKKISIVLAIILCLCMIFETSYSLASGIKIKIGGNTLNQDAESEEAASKKDEEAEDSDSDKKEIKEKEEAKSKKSVDKKESAPVRSSAKESMSNEEFLLTCDYKIVTGTNARILFEDNYSFAFLEKDTYLRYVRNTDDTLEAEVFLDNEIKTAWVPTHNVVLAATIVKDSDGSAIIVNENDPDKDSKIKSGKVLLKPGENPLLNTKKIKNVNTLLFDSKNYNYSGLEMEKDTSKSSKSTSKVKIAGKSNSNQKITLTIGKSNDEDDNSVDKKKTLKKSDDTDKEDISNNDTDNEDVSSNDSDNEDISVDDGIIKLRIGGSKKSDTEENSDDSEGNASNDTEDNASNDTEDIIDKKPKTSNNNSQKATIDSTSEVSMYSKNISTSDIITSVSAGEVVDVYELGYAWSKVGYDGNTGYIPTYNFKFEDGNEFAVVTNKKGFAALYKDSEFKEKLSKIQIGTVVQVIEEAGKALKINYKGDVVYVKFSDMQFISRPSSLDRTGTIKSKNENAKINTRIKDANGAAIVEKLPVGERVTIIKSSDKWVHIATSSGKYAFVQSKFIEEN